ncbi:MAG: SUMF1/EgtB/PvdO family nonheme iron enzyme [Spirochaetes bacterium]|nr:SUMF1/EgtB/PvdO family nonheme iron enzyme [Spirochaetota bacterium]
MKSWCKAMAFAGFLVSALSLAGAQAIPEPRRFAIIVGINQYADSGLVPLQKAQNDAEDLGKLLTRLGGYKAVTVMSGALPYTDVNFPSRNKILERVAALSGIVRPDDQVLFFFSGHGINDRNGESWLLPIDAEVKNPVGTGMSLRDDLASPLEGKVKHIVFLIDACQKTVARDKGLAVVGVGEVKVLSRAVVITSTGKGKASYEDPKGANGLFTRSLLLALNGEGDLNRDGYLSVPELERYLPDAVSEYAFNVGLSQQPGVFDPGAGALQPPLARVGNAPASSQAMATDAASPTAAPAAAPTAKAQFVQFKVPEGVKVDLRLLSADGREVRAWSDTSSLSEKIEPGSYRVEAQDRNYLYYPFSAAITVTNAKVTVNLDLKPNFGSLTLTCDPAEGVEVLLNGEKRGTLSGGALSVERLKSGNYELVLSRELYDTKRQTILIEDGKTTKMKLILVPNFFTLDLKEKNGMAGTVYVDGAQKGSLPLVVKLPYRDANVRVVPGDTRYREWNETVKPASKGGTEKRTAAFSGRMGILEVTTNPDTDAELTLGGVKIGSAPLECEALVGDYDLGASATIGGRKYAAAARVTVREGQTSILKLELKDQTPAPTPAAAAPERATQGFVKIPGGTFTMGSPASEPSRESDEVQRQVTMGTFWMGAYEVTVGEFRAFAAETGYETQAEREGGGYVFSGAEWVVKEDANWRYPYFAQTDRQPVVLVSWYDCIEYCNWRSKKEGLKPAYTVSGTDVRCDWTANGYRLPTEAEWEYACRAGTKTATSFGNGLGSSQANFHGDYPYNGAPKGPYLEKTSPVGSYAKNAWGLYDLHGNVWEWCWDWYGVYATGNQINPRGAAAGDERVARGGGWRYDGLYLRSANRYCGLPRGRIDDMGFRLVRPQF